jgi:hypothetical protein
MEPMRFPFEKVLLAYCLEVGEEGFLTLGKGRGVGRV